MMKKLLVPVLCVLLGCAGGAAMGSVIAQAQTWPQPANAPRWQQECVELDVSTRQSRTIADANVVMRERGQAGWEFIGNPFSSFSSLCFKRPAP